MEKVEIYNTINHACNELTHKLGWSLLYGPYKNMWHPNYPVAFFGLNPGGSDFGEPSISNEDGSSYLVEDWGHGEGKSPLQLQVQALYKAIAEVAYPTITHEDLLTESLATNFVPFRSGDWASLDKKTESLEFSRELWRDRVHSVPTSLYLTMAGVTFNEIHNLLIGDGYSLNPDSITELVGWGNVTYQINKYEKNGCKTALIRVPHMSRYTIFSREQCLPAINHIKSIAKEYLGN